MFATLLAHQAHCSLFDFRGKLDLFLVHGTILSKVGASTIPGVVHIDFRVPGETTIPNALLNSNVGLSYINIPVPMERLQVRSVDQLDTATVSYTHLTLPTN